MRNLGTVPNCSASRNEDVKKAVVMMDGLALMPVQDIPAGIVIVRNFMNRVNHDTLRYYY